MSHISVAHLQWWITEAQRLAKAHVDSTPSKPPSATDLVDEAGVLYQERGAARWWGTSISYQ